MVMKAWMIQAWFRLVCLAVLSTSNTDELEFICADKKSGDIESLNSFSNLCSIVKNNSRSYQEVFQSVGLAHSFINLLNIIWYSFTVVSINT